MAVCAVVGKTGSFLFGGEPRASNHRRLAASSSASALLPACAHPHCCPPAWAEITTTPPARVLLSARERPVVLLPLTRLLFPLNVMLP